MLGKDSSSKKSFLYRYGWAGFRLFREKNKKSSRNKSELIQSFGKDYTDKMLASRGASLENYIAKHGVEEGNIRWENYKDKRAKTYKQKHINGHQFPKYNLEYYIMLYGAEDGTVIYNRKIASQAYKVSLQYYIATFGDKDGREMCKKAKSHSSLEYFISKHGKIDGTTRYLEYISKLSIPTSEKYKATYGENWEEKYNNRFKGSLDCYKKKYGDAEGQLLFDRKIERLSSGNNTTRSRSKISKELFDYLSVFIDDLVNYDDKEFTIFLNDVEKKQYNRYFIRPDLVYNNKIIEFYGDTYHANPAIYKEMDTPNPYNKKITSAQIWNADKIRIDILKNRGYEILVGRTWVGFTGVYRIRDLL